MPVHLANETELVAKARAGNASAFTTLARQYERHLYRVALHIAGSPEDAEDVLQEALLKAFRNIDRFQGGSRFYTWLVRITVNEALMKLRRTRTKREVSLDAPTDNGEEVEYPKQLIAWDESPEQRFATTELRGILTRAVQSLESTYRSVFVLRDIEQLSIEETADALGLSIPAVKSRLLRARLKLREFLTPYFRKEAAVGVS
ncbi:MAG: sigma-70 family RNA polymerase sigma factor [Acidobacteria bacterium]|nr:sigma-70 family RNA polymerase sigma factor [Acidobacteriota bacterium]